VTTIHAATGEGESFALIADVHGNRWALEAVLADIQSRGVAEAVHLGDCLDGPLDPAATADLLLRAGARGVAGNGERAILSSTPAGSAAFARQRLSAEHLAWVRGCPPTLRWRDVFLCHGTPASDEQYLLEELVDGRSVPREPAAVLRDLSDVGEPLVACAHSHVPRALQVGSVQTVVNPGSVGLPAYTQEEPVPHVMLAGSPHARYAMVTRLAAGWRVEHVAVPYDWDEAARVARANGRPDWSEWLSTGWARRSNDAEGLIH
jgi:predicted phosphodiesterase